MFGNSSMKVEEARMKIDASRFFGEVARMSDLGGDILLQSDHLIVELVGPMIDFPQLGISGLVLKTKDQGATDGLGRRLVGEEAPRLVLPRAGARHRRLTSTSAGTAKDFCERSATATLEQYCPRLWFKADGLPMLGSKLFRRRLGKVVFQSVSKKSTYADQDMQVSSAKAASLQIRAGKGDKLLTFILEDAVVTFDDENANDRLIRRLSGHMSSGESTSRRLSAAEAEDREVLHEGLAGSLASHAEEALDEAEADFRNNRELMRMKYPHIGPAEHAAAALAAMAPVSGRRLQEGQSSEVIGQFKVLSKPHEAQVIAGRGSFLPGWQDLIKVVPPKAAEPEISSTARRLKAEGLGAMMRAATAGAPEYQASRAVEWHRRLQSEESEPRIWPTMITKTLAGDLFGTRSTTCKAWKCKPVETVDECRQMAAVLALAQIDPTMTPVSEKTSVPAGCYWQEDGDFTGLYFNEHMSSSIGAEESSSGGTLVPICSCDSAFCPVPDSITSIKESASSLFGCEPKQGKALPKVTGELDSPSLDSLDDECKGSAETVKGDLQDLQMWSWLDLKPYAGKCHQISLSGVLKDYFEAGSFKVFIPESADRIVSTGVVMKNVSFPLLGGADVTGQLVFSHEDRYLDLGVDVFQHVLLLFVLISKIHKRGTK